jgi:hemerythrin-like domain-containing protein
MGSNAPAVHRRRLLGVASAVAGGVPVFTASAAQAASASDFAAITPPEDLMREHGVLKRVLLIYREAIRRLAGDERLPAAALAASAQIIRRFIEEHHERLEERHVFPPLARGGGLSSTVGVLCTQHWRGRVLTGEIHEIVTSPASVDARRRRRLVDAMTAFIRMYEPHEAWEDTVVFPAFRDVVTPDEFRRLGELFEAEGRRRFGSEGFTRVVAEVADIERELGIFELSQFTPRDSAGAGENRRRRFHADRS